MPRSSLSPAGPAFSIGRIWWSWASGSADSFLFFLRPGDSAEVGPGRGIYEQLSPAVSTRFSAFALGAFIYMAVTGIVQGYLYVGSFGLLLPTTYGQALIAKLVLFGCLLLIGTLHRKVFMPRLKDRRSPPRLGFERALLVEIVAGFSLLCAVSLMASLATSRSAWPGHVALGTQSSTTVGGVEVVFRATPGNAGDNAVALDITDRRAGQATTPASVVVRINGEELQLSQVGPLSAGTTQRFAYPSLVRLPQGPGQTISFDIQRPEYPETTGETTFAIHAAPLTASPRSTK